MTTNPPVSRLNGFQRALKDFESRLKPSEKAKFKATTLDDLKVTILAIQSEQRARKKTMHMARIMSFLEAMEQFGKVIEVFLNVADMLAFVWGPVKLLLLTAACWSESFDTLLDAYQLIADNFPIFAGYQSTFVDNDRMQAVLECAWSDILDFHIQALRIFEQSMMRQFFRSLWKDFKSRFQGILNDLKRQKDLVQSHADQVHIHNYEVDRLKIFEEFEQARMKRAAEKKAFVVQWIAAPQTILDHEYLCGIRQQHYDATHRRTGQWILDHEEVKAWMAQQVPKSSSLWITGIAGAEVVNLCDSTNPGKVRVLILSRDEPDIRRALATATVIRLSRQDTLQDIESYIQHHAGLLQQKFKLPDDDREYIEQYVLDKSDGKSPCQLLPEGI
ncbi:hypothetical protein ACHAPT_005115 [Fusarium lateritium]